MKTEPEYVLGHASHEIERLRLQARILEPITRRLITAAGIGPGMRVLDIGCGAGDVALLLAEIVGPTGHVVAFDREPKAVETGRERAAAAGVTQVEFVVAVDDAWPVGPFDAAVGRYVLIHQPDPAAMVRRSAQAVRPGGAIAFHEVALHTHGHVLPTFKLYDDIMHFFMSAFRVLLPSHDICGRLTPCFSDAGLPAPHLWWESVAGDHRSPIWRWMAMNYGMYPQIVRVGLNPTLAPDLEPIVTQMETEAERLRSQIVSVPQACAWVRRP